MFNEGNQIHNFMSSSGSGTVLSKLFYKEKVHEFQQIYAKMWMKKCLMKEIKYIILCLVPVPEP